MIDYSIIVCCDLNGGIALNRKIPWLHEPFAKSDLKNFKSITSGNICVMGRNTYEEMLEFRLVKSTQPIISILPDRQCYMLTSTPELYKDAIGVTPIRNINEVPHGENAQIFIIGGTQLFNSALNYVKNVHITLINKAYGCDSFFPIEYVQNNMRVWNTKQLNDDMVYLHYVR
jgi:dihydrofolate reductase